jgi:hypothetical protein
MHKIFLPENLKGKDQFIDKCMDRRALLKLILGYCFFWFKEVPCGELNEHGPYVSIEYRVLFIILTTFRFPRTILLHGVGYTERNVF